MTLIVLIVVFKHDLVPCLKINQTFPYLCSSF